MCLQGLEDICSQLVKSSSRVEDTYTSLYQKASDISSQMFSRNMLSHFKIV